MFLSLDSVNQFDNIFVVLRIKIKNFTFFICEKWTIASDKSGSGNTANIGSIQKISYTETKTSVLANGKWSIQFNLGSATISGLTKDLETIYNLLTQAEETKLKVIGHTDSTGNPASNVILSKGRANSVVNYLIGRGISKDRFQLIDGKGSSEPVSKNDNENRRVEITLLK